MQSPFEIKLGAIGVTITGVIDAPRHISSAVVIEILEVIEGEALAKMQEISKAHARDDDVPIAPCGCG